MRMLTEARVWRMLIGWARLWLVPALLQYLIYLYQGHWAWAGISLFTVGCLLLIFERHARYLQLRRECEELDRQLFLSRLKLSVLFGQPRVRMTYRGS